MDTAISETQPVRQVLTVGTAVRTLFQGRSDWDKALSSGMLRQYMPNRPDEMYAPEWVSWEEFLGLMRKYDDTRNLAVNVLGLKTFDDYILFVRRNPKRAEGLRIPLRPDLFYKDQWVNEDTFFQRGEME